MDFNSLYIHHHLGLGDHLVCFSIVKYYAQKLDQVYLFVKHHNISSVKSLYKGLPNVTPIPVKNDFEVDSFCSLNKVECFKIGHRSLPYYRSLGLTWAEAFYKQCNIPYSKRWEDFSIKRDLECEEEMFGFKNPNKEKYALIHSVSSTGVDSIDYTQINPSLKQIQVTKEKLGSQSIFDYIKLIFEADEIHCVDSAFIHLVDSFKLKNKLFYHKYFKVKDNSKIIPLQNNWIII